MRNHEIRAIYSQETIRVYQAYPHNITDQAEDNNEKQNKIVSYREYQN